KRFWVFEPSVSRMITLSRSGCGSDAWVRGWVLVRACQPHTSPMVTLVFPDGFIASTLALNVAQSLVRGSASARPEHMEAGNSVPELPVSGAVSCTSKFFARSMTQPFQLFLLMLFKLKST